MFRGDYLRIPPKQGRFFKPTLTDSGGCQYGVNVLYAGVNPVVDIILVHGLGGDPYKTWTSLGNKKNAGTLWPRDLLPKEIPEVRILSYGYDTKVTSWFEGATSNMIHHHSETMISRLHNFRSRKIDGQSATERPIIWIGHSLGGILIKRALIYSNSCGVDHNERLRSIRVSTQGVLFMGTPHMGSDLARWGSVARKILCVFPGVKLDSTMLSMLGQNSETLQNINTLFTGISSAFEIVYFYEELETLLPTGKYDLIVPYASATVDSPNTEKIGIHGTHHTMVKFTDETSPGYSDVAGILRQMVDNSITFTPGRWEAERRSAVAATDQKIKDILVQRGASGLYIGASSQRSIRMINPRRLSEKSEILKPQEVEDLDIDNSDDDIPNKRLALTQGDDYSSASSSLILPPSLPIFAVPLHPNESPVARDYLLKDLDNVLLNEDRRSKGHAGLLLWGPPGSGKTHLVREYVFSRREYFTGGIFWINAGTQASRIDSFRMIYKKLNLSNAVMQDLSLPHVDRQGMDVCTCRVLEWLERNQNWLMILDSANAVSEDEIDDLKACLPTSRGGSVLFTTLNQSLDGQARLGAPIAYKIPQMSLREAVTIFLTEAKIMDPTPQEMKVAAELVELLDYLIGAIHIAACYIAERQVSIYEYVRGYKERPKVSEDGWSPLAMTLDTLETKHPEAANLLKLISFFGSDIPTLLIHWGLESLPVQVRVIAKEEDGMLDFNLTLKHLLAFSLVQRSHTKEAENGKEWRVDRLHLQSVIQTYVRQRLSTQAEVGQAWVKFAGHVLRHAFEKAERQRGQGGVFVKDYEEFILHGDSLMKYLREQKVSRKSIRSIVERARSVINEQQRKEETGNLVEYPQRSIWGRGDMESPEAVYASRKFPSDCSSSATGSSLSASTLSEISKGNTFSARTNSRTTQIGATQESLRQSSGIPTPKLSRASTSTSIFRSTEGLSTKSKSQGRKLQRNPNLRKQAKNKEKKGKERGSADKEQLFPELSRAASGPPIISPPAQISNLPHPVRISARRFRGEEQPTVLSSFGKDSDVYHTLPRRIYYPVFPNTPRRNTTDLANHSNPNDLNGLFRRSELPNTVSSLGQRVITEPIRDPGPSMPLPRIIRRRKAAEQGPQLRPSKGTEPVTIEAPAPVMEPMIGYFTTFDQEFDSTDQDFVTVTSEPGPSRVFRHGMRHKILYTTPITTIAETAPRRQSIQDEFLSAPTSPVLSRIGSFRSDVSSLMVAPGSLVDLIRGVASKSNPSRSSSSSSLTAS